jgi:uncharacterized protein (TIGR00252 family)
MGEIDLVMRDRDCLVFVEVRYRRANRFASAAASVDRSKQRKLMRAAAAFLAGHPEFCDLAVRFDVVAFDAASDDQCTLQWFCRGTGACHRAGRPAHGPVTARRRQDLQLRQRRLSG